MESFHLRTAKQLIILAKDASGNKRIFRKGHERNYEGLEPLVEGFQRAFPADGVAEEHREKIEDFVASEAPQCKAHPLAIGLTRSGIF